MGSSVYLVDHLRQTDIIVLSAIVEMAVLATALFVIFFSLNSVAVFMLYFFRQRLKVQTR